MDGRGKTETQKKGGGCFLATLDATLCGNVQYQVLYVCSCSFKRERLILVYSTVHTKASTGTGTVYCIFSLSPL